ncbi:MAG: DUF4388 domain-containing protein [bacterium]
MAIEGPISELNLIDLFQILSFNQKTGVLYIERKDGGDASVYFNNGSVQYVNLKGYHIGQALIKSGEITKEQYEEEILKSVGSDESKIAHEIIKRGIMGEKAFRKFLVTRVENIIYSLFEWDEGYFKFEEGAYTLDELFKFKIKTESLIMEGSRRIDEWSRLSSKISSTDLKPMLSDNTEKMDVIDLDPKEWEILSMINGENSIKDIAEKYGNEFKIAKLIYGMMTLGIVEVADKGDQQDKGNRLQRAKMFYQDGLYDKAAREIKEFLKDEPTSRDAYIILLSSYYALNQFENINSYSQKAYQAGMEDVSIMKFNAFAYFKQGEIESAVEEINRIIANTDDMDTVNRMQAMIDSLNSVKEDMNLLIGGISG